MSTPRRVLDADGRAKAYRPISASRRAAALREGLAAYERGDFFAAHEILEPAWMGTDDPAERDLYQGLIKLSAAFVHAVRGNPRGTANNLRGARERLARAEAGGATAGIDVPALLDAVDARLAAGMGADGDATAVADDSVDALPIPRGSRGAVPS